MEIINCQKAHQEIIKLIQDFEDNFNHYISPSYKEQEVREDFINKFWIALGWDVNHIHQKNPFQQEVKIEKGQKQNESNTQKRADYAFYLAPNYKKEVFFVEAKKPSRTLRQNKDDYFQTAKYGWNAGTGVSVLTDFEEFVIIDCRFKPDFETILSNQIHYYDYKEFKEYDCFEKIYWLFSREAIAAGNLQTFVENLPKPKGKGKQLKLFAGKYQSIDVSFLNYIDNIRKEMAQALHENCPTLDNYELTEATQRTIDRLVFMRFLEDKWIEPENILYNIAIHPKPWDKFIAESKRLDAKYNGVVFKPLFIDQSNFEGANQDLFRAICQDLDHTNTPYDFNYFPIHILGNIYERFLGKTISIENGKANIDLKPEVRKACGVFYTPKYIVDYIIDNTLGKLIYPNGIAIAPSKVKEITVADIACGSGSFLIGAFEYLIDYHNIYYNNHPEEAQKDGCKYDPETAKWVLTIKQKQDILLNNIYGVDIDHQATEVTQLSLFLKMLEDETMTTANDMQVLFTQKILPDLSNNIKCGNSLIGFEIMNSLFDRDNKYIQYKINPFDYHLSFANVFKNGGFDAIIGNPPYVKEYTEKEVFENVKKGKLARYYQGKMDLWYFFTCYGLDILKENGKLGYIIPNNWISNAGASILRNKVINDAKIEGLIDFGSYMIFTDASIQTMIMLLEKNKIDNNYNFHYQYFNVPKSKEATISKELKEKTNTVSYQLNPTIERKKHLNTFLKFDNQTDTIILDKILKAKNFVFNEKEITSGIHPHHSYLSKKMVELLKNKFKIGTGVFALNSDELEKLNLSQNEQKIIKPFYSDTKQIKKYFIDKENIEWIIYTDSSFKNIDKINEYPKIKNHLDNFKDIITSDNKPYGLHRARVENFFKGEKIISLRMCSEPTFIYNNFDSYLSAAFNIIKSSRINLKYLTAILNSSLIKFWLSKKGKLLGNMLQIDKEPLLQIPIHQTENKTLEQNIIALVDRMITTKTEAETIKTEREKQFYNNLINNLNHQINALVYEMYQLTPEEIAVVEG
jgi:adenine-specific DNA-methyltransferase